MAMTAPTVMFDDTVPGVDLVGEPGAGEAEATLLSTRALTVMASVHRRFLDRRSTLLRNRRLAPVTTPQADERWTTEAAQNHDLRRGPDFCFAEGATWSGRLDGQAMLASADGGTGTMLARVRGWDRTENSVLIDGRAVSGAIFDTIVALQHQARAFENGEQPFALCLPDIRNTAEAQTWAALLNLAQDRVGIPRGNVPVVLSIETDEAVRNTSSILNEFRTNGIGVCVADGGGLDEVAVKEIASDHGVRWIGAIPSSIA